MQWYDRMSGGRFAPLPPWSASCSEPGITGDEGQIQWVYPEGFDVVKRPRDLDGSLQGIVLEVAHVRPEARLFWHDNGVYLGETQGRHVRQVLFAPGRHDLSVVDELGATQSAAIQVVE